VPRRDMIDLEGREFGVWRVLRYSGPNRGGGALWAVEPVDPDYRRKNARRVNAAKR
jgi:hypothetical protein